MFKSKFIMGNPMRKDPFVEKLRLFKEKEKPETVLLISDSPHLTKIVIAWTNTPVKRTKTLSRIVGESELDTWRWLWKNTIYSRDELMERIPSADQTTEKKIDALIANRVLYPDGTTNSYVERFLREKVIKHFIRKTTGRAKTERF